MPVKHLLSKIAYPNWAGARYQRLDQFERFLNGTAYDHLDYPFYYEVTEGGTYIPLRDRRPSVVYNLPQIVVSRVVSLLFAGKHWPKLNTSSKEVTDYLLDLDNQSGLQSALLEAATIGSLGSVAILFTFEDGIPIFEVVNPKFCKPLLNRQQDLESILIMVPTMGYDLRAIGYTIADEDIEESFFFSKKIDTKEEELYYPIKCDDYEDESDLVRDDKRSTSHGFGFVPGIWIKNFPSSNGIDSECTFERILNICVEVDYQLSQCGRGLKYSSDPQLLIKEPGGGADASSQLYGEQQQIRSANTAIIVGEDGDGKLLEISGQGQKTVIEFVKILRQYALEVVRGSHKDPSESYGNMSGRAMEILDEDLIGLASIFRISYGERGLKPLLMKLLRASKKLGLLNENVTNKGFSIKLQWGNWFDPTPQDLLDNEQARDLAVKSRRMYESEARMLAAQDWGLGHTDQAELDKEWEIPPEPQMVKDEKEMAKKPAPGPTGSSGRSGRDSKVTS